MRKLTTTAATVFAKLEQKCFCCLNLRTHLSARYAPAIYQTLPAASVGDDSFIVFYVYKLLKLIVYKHNGLKTELIFDQENITVQHCAGKHNPITPFSETPRRTMKLSSGPYLVDRKGSSTSSLFRGKEPSKVK